MYIVKQIGTCAVVTVVADIQLCGDGGCEWFILVSSGIFFDNYRFGFK